jgi:hypothetical protein
MNEQQVTYQGKINRYADWRDQVLAEADRVGLSDGIREQVTEPMLKDAWRKHERPAFFVAKVAEYFGD